MRPVIQLHLQITHISYEATRYLYADMPEDQKRKTEFIAIGPPIQRSMLDGIFNIVYLLTDLQTKIIKYYKAAYREVSERYDRYEGKYGSLPHWKEWLDRFRKFKERLVADIKKLDPSFAGDGAEKEKWPIPSVMCSDKSLPKNIQDFFTYLTNWFYRSYSQENHLT